METFNFFQAIIDQYGVVGVIVGFVWLHFQIKGMKDNTNTRIDGLEKNINKSIERIENAFVRHEQQCNERHQQFMDYMKEHGDRISKLEGRLDERQQQPAT